MKSRDANTDVKKLIDLLVSDKLKDSLTLSTLQYVLSLEGSKCFTSDEVANNADIYGSNYNDNGSYKGSNLFNVSLHGQGNQTFKKFASNKRYEFKSAKNVFTPTDKESSETANVNTYTMQNAKPTVKKVCFACQSDKHLIADCPKKQSGPSTGSRTFVKSAPGSNATDHATGAIASGTAAKASAQCNASTIGLNCEDYSTCTEGPIVNCDAARASDLKVAPLQYIDVVIASQHRKALIDSSAEVPLIRSNLVPNVSTIGSINIQPFIGQTVPAKLAVLDIAKYDSDVGSNKTDKTSGPLHMVFAVTDLASFEVILPVTAVNELQTTSHMSTEYCTENSMLHKCIVTSLQHVANEPTASVDNNLCTDIVDVNDDRLDTNVAFDDNIANADLLNDTVMQHDLLDSATTNSYLENLVKDQNEDHTLKACKSMADSNKGGYFHKNSVLCHRDHVLNKHVEQIVVSKCRRSGVVAIAHDKTFHQGYRKTSERIRYSFYWPSLRADVINYCTSCKACAQRRRSRVTDRVPIAPVERPSLPGEHLMMDVIGPIDPPSAQGHKYLLNVVCLHSR